MLKTLPIIFVYILSFALLSACGSNPRIEIIAPETEVLVDETQTSVSGESTLMAVHVASVAPPEIETGRDYSTPVLSQATNFTFHKDWAYVSYNTAGEQLAGGIEVFDLKNEKEPKLLASLLSKGLDLSDLKVWNGDYLVATGANENGGVLVIYDIRSHKNIFKISEVSFDGHVGTSLSLFKERAYVTVGDNLGLVVVNIKNPEKPFIDRTFNQKHSVFSFIFDERVFAFGGNPFELSEVLGDELKTRIRLSKRSEEAPARAASRKQFIFANPNQNGLMILNAEDSNNLKIEHQIPVPGTGNGIALFDRYAFLAQGEAGVRIFDIDSPQEKEPRYVGSLDFKNDPGSANQVQASGDKNEAFVFIADGRGGFQIMKFRRAIRLVATKTYQPTKWQDAVIEIQGESLFRIPQEIPVIEGNAGNHWVDLFFDEIQCRYQGGSDQAKPQKNSKQWDKGLTYNKFIGCTNLWKPGDWIQVQSKVRLNVANGHSGTPKTSVQLDLAINAQNDD